MKSMSRREVTKALLAQKAVQVPNKGPHDKYVCGCKDKHTANVPRHNVISPGVVRDIIRRMECMKKGWLQ